MGKFEDEANSRPTLKFKGHLSNDSEVSVGFSSGTGESQINVTALNMNSVHVRSVTHKPSSEDGNWHQFPRTGIISIIPRRLESVPGSWESIPNTL